MMKKMLILALVLVVAGFANAGLLQDIKLRMDTPGVVIVQGLAGGNTYGDSGFGIYAASGLIIEPVAVLGTTAGDLAAITYQAAFGGVDCAPLSSLATGKPVVVAGDWFSFGYTGQVGSMVDIYDYAISADTAIGQLQITGIPEPMTMVLLGLGGLFLRKKK